MIFDFKPATFIIDKVKRRLKTFNEQGRINQYDCIEYIYDAMRDIGVPNLFIPKYAIVEIVNHKGYLPSNQHDYCDIYQLISAYSIQKDSCVSLVKALFNVETNTDKTVEKVDNCTGEETIKITVTTSLTKIGECPIEEQGFCKITKSTSTDKIIPFIKLGYPMRYGGQWMKILSDSNNTTNILGSADTFMIDRHEILTSFKDGWVLLFYNSFDFNEEGIPMVPDNIDVEKALEAFLIMRLLEEDYYMKTEGSAQVFKDAELKWSMFKDSAQQKLLIKSLPEAERDVANNRSRYHRFNLRRNYNNGRWRG